MASEVSDLVRRHVADRAFRVCEYCLVHEDDLYYGCEVDHSRSRKHGGPTIEENLALASVRRGFPQPITELYVQNGRARSLPFSPSAPPEL